MEEYEDLEGDPFGAFHTPDTPDTTTPGGGQENEFTDPHGRQRKSYSRGDQLRQQRSYVAETIKIP